MELLAGFGLDAVAAHAQGPTSAVADGAGDLGFGVPTRSARSARSSHLLGLRVPAGLDAAKVAARLREHQVHVSVRGTSLRVSAHGFNTVDDVGRLLRVLGTMSRTG